MKSSPFASSLSSARFLAILGAGMLMTGGCASFSAHSTAAASPKDNSRVMRTVLAETPFQPLQPVRAPRYQQLSTTISSSTSIRNSSAKPQKLPHLTPVKVLKANKSYALIQLRNGKRGFVATGALGDEDALFSTSSALAALPVLPEAAGYDPVTGLPLGFDGSSSEMIITDPLVDQAMLNDVDQIQLPESEAEFQKPTSEADMVDDVLIRNPAPVPGTQAAAAPGNF